MKKTNKNGKKTQPHKNEGQAGHLNKAEKLALQNLKSNRDLVIRSADKGGGIVLQNYGNYEMEAQRILSDKEYYKVLTTNPTPELQKRLKLLLQTALTDKIINKKEQSFILIPNPNMAFFLPPT